jgi:hypothetical protein
MKKISLVFLSLIIASLALPMSMINYRAIQFAYAQTNAVMLTALASNNNNDNSSFTNNAAAYSNTANTITSAASNTTAGLQMKTDVNYFDSSSGYLV